MRQSTIKVDTTYYLYAQVPASQSLVKLVRSSSCEYIEYHYPAPGQVILCKKNYREVGHTPLASVSNRRNVLELVKQELKMPLRTEKEKMLSVERYNCHDPDLEAGRQKAKEMLRLYNLTEAVPEQQTIQQQLLGQIGRDSFIDPPFCCSYGQNIHIGDHVYLNSLCTVIDNSIPVEGLAYPAISSAISSPVLYLLVMFKDLF